MAIEWIVWNMLLVLFFALFFHIISITLAPELSYYKSDIKHRISLLRMTDRQSRPEHRASPLESASLAICWFVFYLLDVGYSFILLNFRYKVGRDEQVRVADAEDRFLFAASVDIYSVVVLLGLGAFYFSGVDSELVAAFWTFKIIHLLSVCLMMVLEIGVAGLRDYSYGFTRNVVYTVMNFLFISGGLAYLLPSFVDTCGVSRSDLLLLSMTQLLSFDGLDAISHVPWLRFVYAGSTFLVVVLFLANIQSLRRLKATNKGATDEGA